MECLSESEIFDAAASGLPENGEARRHIDGCADCRALLAEVARDTDGASTPAASPLTFSGAPPDGPQGVPGGSVGRYRLSRLLGEGAMGEVWAARDEQLDREVALKLLRGRAAGDERSRERLLREARALARLSHPNAVRVYDAGEAAGRLFLALELVDGTTLRAWLKERPRSWREALIALVQAGRGLAAAHAAGLVHRDFKPDNVLIDSAGLARVTDFGLARPLAEPEVLEQSGGAAASSPGITRSGALVGTPAYMSPEQLDRRPADARSDAFSFAVTLWEALFGERPYAGNSVQELRAGMAAGALHPPRRAGSVPSAVRRALERSLRPAPADRFASLDELLAALERAAGLGKRRTFLAAGLALAAAACLLAVGLARKAPLTSVGAARVGQRQAIAVLPLAAAPGAPAWVGTALPEMLRSELAAADALRAVPQDSVARLFGDLGLSPGAEPSAELLARVKDRLGASAAVAGSYANDGGRVKVRLALYDTASGAVLARSEEALAPHDLIEAAAHAGAKLREALGAAAATPATAAARSAFPRAPEAARLYAEGLALLRSFDARGARDRLQAAALAEPDHPLVQAALADALAELGYEALAQTHARRAIALSGQLPREERLSLETRAYEILRQWNKAFKMARGLFTVFSDDLEHGLVLARVETKYGKAKEALDTIRDLRKLPAPASADPRISLAEGQAADALTDPERQLAAGSRALAEGQAQGARLLIARALGMQAAALYRTGKYEESMVKRRESMRLFHELGALGQEVGAEVGLGWLLIETARLDEADAVLAHAVATAQSIGNEGAELLALGNVGIAALRRQDLGTAERVLVRSLELSERLGDKAIRGRTLLNLGNVLRERGKLPDALARYQQSLAVRQELGESVGTLYSLGNIALVLRLMGDNDGAEQKHAELRKAAGAQHASSVATYDEELAELRWQQGRPREAQQLFESSIAALEKQGRVDYTANALCSLARLSVAQGQLAKAREQAARALKLNARSQNLREGYWVRAECGYVQGATGDAKERAAALADLTRLTGELQSRGLVELHLSARLLLGELELRSNLAGQGRERLRTLTAEADGWRFHAIARKARQELAEARK